MPLAYLTLNPSPIYWRGKLETLLEINQENRAVKTLLLRRQTQLQVLQIHHSWSAQIVHDDYSGTDSDF